MSSTTPTTVVGFVARDVEVKRSQSGKNYVTVSVPHQRSRRGQDGQWENVGETTWHQATFYDDEADVVARSVSKGTKVVVTGTPEAYAFTAQDGSAGAAVRLLFPTLGVVPRVQRQQGGAPAGGQQGQGWPTQQPGQPGQHQGSGAQGQDVWSQPGTYDDETPF